MSPQEAARLGPGLTQVMRGLTERQGWLLVLAPLSNVALAGHLPEDAVRLAKAASQVRGGRFDQVSRLPMTDAEARMRATELTAAARARRVDTFGAIRQGLAWLARQPGRHSLLLLTSGFTHDPSDPSFGPLVTESLRVNAPIHFLDVASLSAFGTFETVAYPALPQVARVSPFEGTDAVAGTDLLARNTGGLRVSGSDLAGGLTQLLDTTKTYYILGYEPVKKKAGFRRIKVRLKDGRNRSVLARRGYFDDGTAETPGAVPAPRR